VVETPPLPEAPTPPPKPRGRRPHRPASAATAPNWLYHHLTISGPAEAIAGFVAAAHGSGVIPWRLDFPRIEEDIFHLAAAQPVAQRRLTIAGCHLLARQFRQRVEAHHAKAVSLIGRSRACPLDLHALLPVPASILELGPTHPEALAWLAAHWGTTDQLRQVSVRPKARPGRRLPAGHAVIGYGFFTAGETPHAAIARLSPRWSTLRFVLRPRPLD
jgi:hypothetical protein